MGLEQNRMVMSVFLSTWFLMRTLVWQMMTEQGATHELPLGWQDPAEVPSDCSSALTTLGESATPRSMISINTPIQ